MDCTDTSTVATFLQLPGVGR